MQLYQLSFPNGKKYIGITSGFAIDRFKKHCQKENNKNICQKAIKKYGKENVSLKVLATVDDWELLCLMEQEAIEKFNTKSPHGYNLTDGGEGSYGRIISDETRKKMSYVQKRNMTEERRKMIVFMLKNRPPVSEETKKKIAISNTGRHHTNDTKAKISKANTGKKRSKESIEKRLKSLKESGYKASKETGIKISMANTGRKHTEEAKNKISIANIGRKLSEEQKRKISERMIGFKHTEETKRKVSENNPRKRAVSINGVIYNSMTHAGRCLGLSLDCVRYRALSDNFDSYFFI